MLLQFLKAAKFYHKQCSNNKHAMTCCGQEAICTPLNGQSLYRYKKSDKDVNKPKFGNL